mgnify:FL=1
MKLITEVTEEVQFITEVDEKTGKNTFYIDGIFMQSEKKNRNGRVYPHGVLMKEVNRYNTQHVLKNRALGELNHPQGPTVNLDRVSHIIKELKEDGDNVYGKAKIMETPMGKIVRNLMSEGASLGVSSRGMGSLKKLDTGINEVQEDFMLSAVDIVADPSAPDAFVNGIMEGREWVWDNGLLRESEISDLHKEIVSTNSRKLEEKTIEIFKKFLSKL